MKKILLMTVVSLSLITSTAILAKDPKVTTCPGVTALQSVKFDTAREVNGSWQVGVIHNKFDTDIAWTFFIEGISAKDANAATNIGIEAVKTLSFVSGPIHVNKKGYEWDYCEYSTAIGYVGYTYAPAFDGKALLTLPR